MKILLIDHLLPPGCAAGSSCGYRKKAASSCGLASFPPLDSDADVELAEVERFCAEHGLWPG